MHDGVATWIPVYCWKSRRSPQSHKAVKSLMSYYDLHEVKKPGPSGHKLDCMESCWSIGWRWCYDELGTSGLPHTWYAPVGVESSFAPEGHFGSTSVLPLLRRMGEPVNAARFEEWCRGVDEKEGEKKSKAQKKPPKKRGPENPGEGGEKKKTKTKKKEPEVWV
ncbi:hypothetical protein TrRE_jg12070 [Triparma retinervis]|uniref:Uncharacterized protein n=1 Tax=Triparma retinervis TaxID=2557542 RepID=A0A9W7DMQ7_9STRA|nr:hypothetical protein TrRE_jg12070 [Triparma retinervis]